METPEDPHGRLAAIAEVVAVFGVTFCLIWSLGLLPLGATARSFTAYAVMLAMPVFVLLVTRRKLADYGLVFRPLHYHLDIALAAFIPVAVADTLEGWLLPLALPRAAVRWEGALLYSLIGIATLLAVAWMLRNKRTLAAWPPLIGAVLLLGTAPAVPALGMRLVAFVFYLCFLGPGEELLFRGYIQSHLNLAFGRPYRLFGVPWGWGLLITCLIFGVMHALNPFNPFLGRFALYGWWGVWTVFGGMVYGFVREKSGSILASALLHGLPQAIAALMLGLFSIR